VALARNLINPKLGELLRLTALPVEANIDRTGTLDFGIDCKVLDPMPAPDPNFRLTFDEVSDIAAREIIDSGEPFEMYWSGGLDSTWVLCALLRAGVPKDQMTVVLSGASKAEYIWFYERFIQGQLNERPIGPSVFKDIRYDRLMVTGELGDQMFGSMWVNTYDIRADYTDVLNNHWHHHLDFKYPAEQRGALIEMYEPFVAAAPFEIRSVFDFLWWTNFACKWQHVVMRMASAMKDVNEYLANTRPFYRTEAFQQWSMNEENHRLRKTGAEVTSYKLALRDCILNFTGDRDYVQFKRKVGSLPMKYAPRYMMVLETGERVKFGDRTSEDAKAYDEKYGDRFDYLFHK
jgi:hypothetical protein